MATLKFESPLNWPDWLPPTPKANQRNDHGFTTQLPLTDSLNYLQQEVQDLSGSATLSLDIEQPTIERLRKKVGSRTGACLTLKIDGRNYLLTCDRWQLLEHNIYALHLAIRQWRNIERWGVGPFSVLLHGFELGENAASGASAGEILPWMLEMGLGPTATIDDAVAIYHRRAKAVAGDADALVKLNLIMDQARAHFGSKGG